MSLCRVIQGDPKQGQVGSDYIKLKSKVVGSVWDWTVPKQVYHRLGPM